MSDLIEISQDKYLRIRDLSKSAYDTLTSVQKVSGLVTDKSPLYGNLNQVLEQIILARTLYMSVAKKYTKRVGVKTAVQSIEFAANYLQSVLDTIENREADSNLIETLHDKVAKNIRGFFTQMKETVNMQASGARKTGSTEIHAKRMSLEDARRQAQSLFRKNSKHKSKLPKSKFSKKTLVVMEVPIIPIFKKMITPKELESLGFDIQSVGFYSVLENQLVVGINYQYTKEQNIKNKDYINHVTQSLSKKTGHSYMVLDDKPIKYGNSGFLYYWLIDEKDLNRLTRAGVREAGIANWGFAF